MIGVYVPSLGRAERLQGVADNIHAATSSPHEIVFVTEASDPDSLDAARATGELAIVNQDEPSYSNSLQAAFDQFDHEFFIGANDDFDFQPGWDVEALAVMRSEPHLRVVGIHDGNPGCNYSTISLVARRYIVEQSGVIDMPGRVNYPYRHNFVDTEFFGTALKRGVFKAAPLSRIVHRHPDFGHGRYDKTYNKSRSSFHLDSETFQSRAHLWTT